VDPELMVGAQVRNTEVQEIEEDEDEQEWEKEDSKERHFHYLKERNQLVKSQTIIEECQLFLKELKNLMF
jgi:hypothetical protein